MAHSGPRTIGSTTACVAAVVFTILVGCGQPPSGPEPGNREPVAESRQPAPAEDRPVHVAPGVSYVLEDGEESHRQYPDTFEIPRQDARENLVAEQLVKLMFRITADGKTQTERMWVIVKRRDKEGYRGVLDNDPVCTKKMTSGLEVRFEPRHVIAIYEDREEANPRHGSEHGQRTERE